MKALTSKREGAQNGSALLIVLAFVLLLTIVTTAFLSKALLEKTVSNASADQTRTDVFATGAVDAILSDCQQEIAAGSTLTMPTGTHTTIYTPATAKTVVPSRMGYGSSISAIGFSNQTTLPNLVKSSACQVPFYPTGDSTDFPKAGTYPPNEKTFAAADPNDSTAASSLNGRAYSATRWNQALLLPKADLTTSNYTSYLPNSKFIVPDWILVQRDGSNATAWSSSLTVSSPNDVTTTTKNPVVGRYAYTIYDEGGLLDMNVAGYHHLSAPANQTQRFYRSSLATVDLTQLAPFTAPSTIGTAFLTSTLIDPIVGWRNFATLQASGTMPTYTVTAANATNYFLNVQPPGTGFLHTTVPTSPNMTFSLTSSQTDRKFSSRQQLINLLMNDVAQSNTDKANLQNALQYMGTFSRDLNQPSYQPDANRPRISPGSGDPASNGGNAAGTDDANNAINVPFASTLIQTTTPFTRNDGSPANVGDPLVKKRFALNRIAWLTFLGPIADDNGNLNNSSSSSLYVAGNAANFTAIINALETQYGLTPAFLARGGPTNIANYFGLTWKQDSAGDGRYKWFYNVHNNSAGVTGKGIIRELGGTNAIANASDTSPHEPDFFELLKASILAGSKGKTLTFTSAAGFPPANTDAYNPLREQYNADVSLDFQVLQIGANIIDQYDTDSYATEIVFDNGVVSYSSIDDDSTGEPKIIRGVENLPYLYRVRTGDMILRNPNTVVNDAQYKNTTFGGGPYTTTAIPGFKDTGVAALMEIPEIWDPFDANASTGSNVVAYPSTGTGQTFRLIADSADPSTVASGAVANYTKIYADAANTNAQGPVNQSSPAGATGGNDYCVNTGGSVAFTYSLNGAGGAITTGFSSTTAQAMTAATTELDFNAPTSTLYREPTLLSRPNLPAGSGLKFGSGFPAATSDLYKVNNSAGTQCWSSTLGGFIADTRNANPLSLSATPATNAYLGVILGLYPLQWAINNTGNCIYDATVVYPLGTGGSSNVYVTYRLQYRDPNAADSNYTSNWVTYDEKYMNLGCSWTNGYDGFIIDNQATATTINSSPVAGPAGTKPVRSIRQQSGSWQGFADPRTTRFGTFDLNAGFTTPSPVYYSSPEMWLDQANGILTSDRPDSNLGYAMSSTASTYAYLAPGWVASTSQASLWWGATSVNTESQTSGTKGYRFGSVSNPAIANDTSTPGTVNQNQSSYYADADGVVRRAMGGNVAINSSQPTYLYGYPMATATTGPVYTIGANQSKSRPYILNRPFRMVGELGYVFTGTPWKNLDFTNPESGDAALLDVFCINDTDDPNGLVAGKVNLNTQQVPVLATILSGAYYDDVNANKTGTSVGAGYIGATDIAPNNSGSAYTTAAYNLANMLVNGGTTYLGTSATPLMNVRELVGKYGGASQPAGTIVDGTATASFSGFGTDIGSFYAPSGGAAASYYNAYQPRFREAAVRALSAVGQTRVWNLMIDVVAQTGRYPATATNASNFVVEGERRYWVHVAIDRYTGNILDRQIEEVRQ